jgi:DNA-directed RNA polymerase specialized sigma24 family protein
MLTWEKRNLGRAKLRILSILCCRTSEIAEMMDVPIDTVISGLARRRAQLRERLLRTREREVKHGVRQ